MPLLAFNRKDTGGESIGSGSPLAADFASIPGKDLHCGGIVTGAAGTGDRLTQLWLRAFFGELAYFGRAARQEAPLAGDLSQAHARERTKFRYPNHSRSRRTPPDHSRLNRSLFAEPGPHHVAGYNCTLREEILKQQ